ncbi:MAG: chlorophyllase/cutinase-like alpha/beta fold protein [Saprospiraceae bacterium]
MRHLYLLLVCTGFQAIWAQKTWYPDPATYRHAEVRMRDFATKADGYWLFEPVAPVPDTANVVVFLHGYGGYNPVLYGQWIKHLVAQGLIVVYPRYQKNLLSPRPVHFAANAATAVRDALERLRQEGRTFPRADRMLYIGHSYGGVTAANMGVDWAALGIPQPKAMLLCEPGSGPIRNAVKKSYEGLPADLLLLTVVGNKDEVVADTFSRLVFETAVHTPMRNLVEHYSEPHKDRRLTSSHYEPYSVDPDMDCALRNYTVNRAAINNRVNAVDQYCYWKLADALMDILRTGRGAEVAFGNTPAQRYMGQWFDGDPVRPLRVEVPRQTGLVEKQEVVAPSASKANK